MTSEREFRAVKYAGAVYLLFRGLRALRDEHANVDTHASGRMPMPWGKGLWRGILVSVTNPKVFVLYAAILPQFVVRSEGSPTMQMLQLSVIVVLIGLVTEATWAPMAGAARDWFANSPRRLRAVGVIGGASIATLGLVTLVTDESPGKH